MTLIIRSGTLVTPAETFQADILVDGGKIVEISAGLPVPQDAQVVDARNRYVLPGGVDAHVHLELPMAGTVSSDDHYTGSKAAAFGGVTTMIEFVPHDAAPLPACVERWHAVAAGKAAVDYAFHMNITRLDAQVEADIPGLVNVGITSLKVFTAYPNLRLHDRDIFRVMRIARQHGMLTMLHAENGDVIDILVKEALAAGNLTPEWHALTRPAWGAVEAGLRGAALAAMAEAPLYIVHMNVGGELDQLQYTRRQGLPIMGETCPQYLFFNHSHLQRPDSAKWVCSPPMRSPADNDRLWEGVVDGSIQVIATDHCPFFYNGSQPIVYEGRSVAIPGKELGAGDFTKIPNGLPGLGDRLPVLWTKGVGSGRITPSRFVALNCANPAKIFGLYPQKGALVPGADADIVLWDPHKTVTYGVSQAHHRTDYNLYEGWQLTGMPVKVFLRGTLVVDGDRWLGRPGQGRYVKRHPFAPIL